MGILRLLQEHIVLKRRFLHLPLIADICTVMSLALVVLTIFIPNLFYVKILLFVIGFFILFNAIAWFLKREIVFDDIDTRYSLQLTSKDGDCWVERETTMLNTSKLSLAERLHVAFSTGTPMQSFKEIKLSAWDTFNNILNCVPIKDDPTYKTFKVQFQKSIGPSESYTYGYKYFWSKLFPNNIESFVAKDLAPQVEFIVELRASGIELERFVCQEVGKDGKNMDSYEIYRHEDRINKRYRLKVAKANRYSDIDLQLTLKRST